MKRVYHENMNEYRKATQNSLKGLRE